MASTIYGRVLHIKHKIHFSPNTQQDTSISLYIKLGPTVDQPIAHENYRVFQAKRKLSCKLELKRTKK